MASKLRREQWAEGARNSYRAKVRQRICTKCSKSVKGTAYTRCDECRRKEAIYYRRRVHRKQAEAIT